jgi:hypothetical protein
MLAIIATEASVKLTIDGIFRQMQIMRHAANVGRNREYRSNRTNPHNRWTLPRCVVCGSGVKERYSSD